MKTDTLHILIVEDNPDAVELLEEAFLEIAEKRFSQSWWRPCRRDHTAKVGEALALLRCQTFDAILLDLAVPGTREASAFDILHDEAPLTPVIILASPGDEALAFAAIRRGAHDFVSLQDLDTIPLARSIRAAVERGAWWSASHLYAGIPAPARKYPAS